jgi:hypothetical protein
MKISIRLFASFFLIFVNQLVLNNCYSIIMNTGQMLDPITTPGTTIPAEQPTKLTTCSAQLTDGRIVDLKKIDNPMMPL